MPATLQWRMNTDMFKLNMVARAATAAGPNGPTQQNHGSNATQNSNDNIHNGVLPTDAAMAPTTVAPRVLFMSSGTSTPSPAVSRRRSRSQPSAARAEQADVPASITPPVGAPRAQNSPLTAGRAVRRRAGPNDPEVDSLEEALRALREQQRHDHNALVKLDIMMADQTRALEAQRKWNEDNSRRVLAMEGAIQAATVTFETVFEREGGRAQGNAGGLHPKGDGRHRGEEQSAPRQD